MAMTLEEGGEEECPLTGDGDASGRPPRSSGRPCSQRLLARALAGSLLASGLLALALRAAASLCRAGGPLSGPAAAEPRVEDFLVAMSASEAPVAVPGMGLGFPHKELSPSLFCFSVMQPGGGEEELIKYQLKHRRSIFACDDFAVISPVKKLLGYGHQMSNGTWVPVYSWYNPVPKAKFGNRADGDATDSFKNSLAFMQAWDTLSKSKAMEGHDWVAKADPDAVFFPYRLRRHVKRFQALSVPIYLKNCKRKEGWTDDYLFGALEVFNSAAVSAYAQRGESCKNLPYRGWGEDMWIARCMESLGAQMRLETELVGDKRCVYAPCTDVWRPAFHDYKAVGDWDRCWRASAHSEAALEEAKRRGEFCCRGKDPCGNCSARKYPGEDWCTSAENCGACGVRRGGCGG